ncbi:unnamed protein product [Ceutorhynchus assimilis]|uniref:BHLH domain-containing protein n=1 Tax=Ceutorhynchus assimilis TaxID=467358 RepID=A0A9N9MKP5_9CUCU|nr:unnamed protein product [Ceutorhynchus assimilis]
MCPGVKCGRRNARAKWIHNLPFFKTIFSSVGKGSEVMFGYIEEEVLFYEKSKKPSKAKSYSGHVPHKEKPPQVVAKRNARERRRVEAVNDAFVKLRNAVPIQNTRGKRISKVKTLLCAIDYIRALDQILQDCHRNFSSSYNDVLQLENEDRSPMAWDFAF